MSYDIFVQDLPADATSIEDVPDDFRPQPLGPRGHILDTMLRIAPSLTMDDSGWGTIEDADYSVEVNLGTEDPVHSFAFHVRGEETGLFVVSEILSALGYRALAPGTATGFFSLSEDQRAAYARWRRYLAHTQRGEREVKPP